MIKVSIVVPVYRAENYLSKCVESIINQSYSNIEIILVNDGSPDNSGSVCDNLAKNDDRIIVIHKENGGVSSARNAGIKVASGEYILFVDSDDWVENNYVEVLLNTKSNYPNSEPLCGFRTVSDYNGTLIANNVFSSEEETEITFDKYMLLVQGWLAQSPCNKLFNATIIKKNNLLFDVSLSLGEDMLFCMEYYLLCKSKSVICVNLPLYNYIRTEKESLDNKYYPNILEIDEKIYSRLKECIIHWNADSQQMQKFYDARFYRYVYALSNTYREGNKESKKEKRKTNNRILKSKEFKNSLALVSYIHPVHKFAYKSGCWCAVKLAYKITALKKIFKKG